jgi:hypothetical protein
MGKLSTTSAEPLYSAGRAPEAVDRYVTLSHLPLDLRTAAHGISGASRVIASCGGSDDVAIPDALLQFA